MDFESRQQEAEQSTMPLGVLLVLGSVAITAVVATFLAAVLYLVSGEIQALTALAIAASLTVASVLIGNAFSVSDSAYVGLGEKAEERRNVIVLFDGVSALRQNAS